MPKAKKLNQPSQADKANQLPTNAIQVNQPLTDRFAMRLTVAMLYQALLDRERSTSLDVRTEADVFLKCDFVLLAREALADANLGIESKQHRLLNQLTE